MISNPFLALMDYSPDHVYNRDAEVHAALYKISNASPGIMEFFGLPEMGKSTLLTYIGDANGAIVRHPEWLLEPFRSLPERLIPIHIRFTSLSRNEHPIVYLYTSFRNSRRWRELGIELPTDSGLISGLSPEDAAEQLQLDVRYVASVGARPVFLLDDFDIAFERLTKPQTDKLRPLRDFAAFILVTERSLLEVNPQAAGSPFTQTIAPTYIGGLSHAEAAMLVEQTSARAGNRFSQADIDFVIECAGGHPYLLILAGRALWEMRTHLLGAADASSPLNHNQRMSLRGRLYDDFSRTFQRYWERLDDVEHELLKLLATGRSSQLGEIHYQAILQLGLEGLVSIDLGEGNKLFSPLFAQFVEQIGANDQSELTVGLSAIETSLFDYLRRHAREVCTFSELWQNVWKEAPPRDEQLRHIVGVTVSRLRKKLKHDGVAGDIISVREMGYRYVPTT